MPDEYLDSTGVARLLGVSPATIRAYRSRRQAGFPEPDVMVGDTAGWLPSTIEQWQAQRRGPGNWRRDETNAERVDRAVRLLHDNPAMTGQQLADALGITRDQVAALVDLARDSGLLSPTDAPASRQRRHSKEN